MLETMETEVDPTEELAEELAACRRATNPLDRFNSVVLQRDPYWSGQRCICRALMDPGVRTVAVKAGHMVGKSYLAAGVVLGWLSLNPDSMVISTGPTSFQIANVLWREIRQARAGSPLLRRVGTLLRSPSPTLTYADGWAAFGVTTSEPERLQGLHPRGPVLVVVDEASGVNDPAINAALDSLKPVKKLLISNPLKNYGIFYDACQRGLDDPSTRVIRIPSTDSPDIGIEHSPRGLADAAWLRSMIADYGANSQTIKVRVGAEFPDSSDDALIPSPWLDRAEKAVHQPGGPRRLSIDLALGGGGDEAVLVARDDNGVLGFESSNLWNLEATATKASLLCQRWGVEHHRVTFDIEGLGADFANRLKQVGIVGARPYRGQTISSDPKFSNLRTACHMVLRWRLDPQRTTADGRTPPPFAIPREFMARLRREVRELTISTGSRGQTILRPKKDVQAALRHSPDYSDTLAQSFAYPHS